MAQKCFYCEKTAEYNDLVKEGDNYVVTGVCKKHATNYYGASWLKKDTAKILKENQKSQRHLSLKERLKG